jgi:hypothetical protein
MKRLNMRPHCYDRTKAMTEGEVGNGNAGKARRSSLSDDRNVRGGSARSLASQQRPASIESTEIELHPQPILRKNEPAFHPMQDRDGSAHADSRNSRPQQSVSIRTPRWCHERHMSPSCGKETFHFPKAPTATSVQRIGVFILSLR